ncbi:GNAT family N-acetyltransferase [Longimicrobium sp.]|jgi:GNAT superfamily N-acetyltransferase|uniref:GNAT family N-acetyltransferase n=1 Tax=Longimicrobium sp. TaxID=2029185 RepID=UPI002ED8BD5E
MDIRIRPPADADLPALAALMADLGYPASPEQLRARLARIHGNHEYATLVAEVDGEVVGMIGLQRGWAYEHDRPVVRILALVVSEVMRGRGVGARLVDEAEEWADERGAYAVHLTTSLHRDEAHRFYERMGFERTGWRYVRRMD